MNANYFDAQSSIIQPANIRIDADQIKITTSQFNKFFSKKTTRVAEPYLNAALILQFDDGSHCEIHAPVDQQAALTQIAYQASLVEHWQRNWGIALFAIAVVLALFYGSYRYGGPILAKQIVPMIPQQADDFLGTEVESMLDADYFTESDIKAEQAAQITKVFEAIKPNATRIPLRLELRKSEKIGANALALPNGSIYLTDAMVQHMPKQNSQATSQRNSPLNSPLNLPLTSAGEMQLAGVLAHEIAHIELRHSMHNITETSLMTVLLGATIGDFSNILSVAAGGLLNARYSQEKESEADEYAIRLLQSRGISPAHLADLFESLDQDTSTDKSTKKKRQSSWLEDQINDYLSSHPMTEKRIERFRQAAK
ncbi:M48 family metallopeptidase [Undibacterium macrobrachii]|jgi:Zn-dependent protease with chaperone function|uniref:Peptidase M48 n=1 Tax=Undibacterium macrobrachii TaxID=1119058 RepID=A0ABQ2XN13_9BURK|nr:M48 family metallopeptidase [Undibacterium macrobrachii]GGX24505.1 peptidase M48 [Undibacterium macrobrachii]